MHSVIINICLEYNGAQKSYIVIGCVLLKMNSNENTLRFSIIERERERDSNLKTTKGF
jgi:hypothetical protein